MTCKKHANKPVIGYSPCAACEIEYLNHEIENLRNEVSKLKDRAKREIEEWNAGYDCGSRGGRADDEPTEGIVEDHWRIGFQAGAYQNVLDALNAKQEAFEK